MIFKNSVFIKKMDIKNASKERKKEDKKTQNKEIFSGKEKSKLFNEKYLTYF